MYIEWIKQNNRTEREKSMRKNRQRRRRRRKEEKTERNITKREPGSAQKIETVKWERERERVYDGE